jgi:hypothetical protein
MTETPEAETSHTQATRSSYDGWQLSEETREEDRVFDERADARERWESQQYGWALFAVVTLVLAGAFQVINGFIALYRSGTYLVGRSGLVLDVDYSTWGWIHLGLGFLAIVAAVGLTRGQMWARILGVSLSVVSAIVYMAFTAAFPALCLVVIAVNILVIYAITVHGRDLKDADH